MLMSHILFVLNNHVLDIISTSFTWLTQLNKYSNDLFLWTQRMIVINYDRTLLYMYQHRSYSKPA